MAVLIRGIDVAKNSLYNGHLSRLYGIFGFSADKEFYDGVCCVFHVRGFLS